jgi:hypothetical protein
MGRFKKNALKKELPSNLIGGISVTLQNREGRWVIVCRSHGGGILEVP